MAACLSEGLWRDWAICPTKGSPAAGVSPHGTEDPSGPYTKCQKGASPSIPGLFLFSLDPGSRWRYQGSRRKPFASATLVLKGVGTGRFQVPESVPLIGAMSIPISPASAQGGG